MIDPSFIFYWGNNTYRASQFAIRLDGPIDPNTIKTDIKDLPSLHCLFLHEYIHFIQDVTTRYGLMKAANLYAYTSQIAHCIRIDSKNDFLTPQSLSKCNHVDNVIYCNAKTWKHNLGDSFELKSKYERKKLEIRNYRLYSIYVEGKALEKVELTVGDSNGAIIGNILFGGEIMSESMAFIAEALYAERHGVPIPNTPDYPYRITEYLVEKIYPDLVTRRDIVYLCIDLCLYRCFNPGPVFIHLLRELSRQKFHENWDIEVIIQTLDILIKYDIPYSKCIEETVRLIKWNFQIPALDATIKWIEHIYNRSFSVRQYPMFTKCFVGNTESDQQFSQIVMDIMGIPPLLNDRYEASMTIPMNMMNIVDAYDVHPEYFNAISCLLSVFNGKRPCGMKGFCKASSSVNKNLDVNQTCDEPWLKLSEAVMGNKRLCPFAFLWKHWGLSNKVPV